MSFFLNSDLVASLFMPASTVVTEAGWQIGMRMVALTRRIVCDTVNAW